MPFPFVQATVELCGCAIQATPGIRVDRLALHASSRRADDRSCASTISLLNPRPECASLQAVYLSQTQSSKTGQARTDALKHPAPPATTSLVGTYLCGSFHRKLSLGRCPASPLTRPYSLELWLQPALGSALTNRSSRNSSGTAVYIDGQLRRLSSEVRLTCESLAGNLLLANSPNQYSPWQGRIFLLAIYPGTLDAATVLRHYRTLTSAETPDSAYSASAFALYSFSERAGQFIHDQTHTQPVLAIPPYYSVLHPPFLTPAWEEYTPALGTWRIWPLTSWALFRWVSSFVPH